MSGRIRTVKPDLFKHEALYDAETETGLPLRLAFIGLFTQCDKEGRFRWRPRALKSDILPYDEVDFSRVLDALAARGFVVHYASVTGDLGCIPSWHRHQVVNNREKNSNLPSPDDAECQLVENNEKTGACLTRAPRDTEVHVYSQGEGEGEPEREGGVGAAHQSRAREAAGFSEFWNAWPNKVGKGAARKAFAKALKLTSTDRLVAGVERYIRDKPPDRQWCNPATWLNQERWTDTPAPAVSKSPVNPVTAALNKHRDRIHDHSSQRQPMHSGSGGSDGPADIVLLPKHAGP